MKKKQKTNFVLFGAFGYALAVFGLFIATGVLGFGEGARAEINNHNYKRHIFNPEVFKMYTHLKWENIKQVSQETLNSFQTSNLYRSLNDYKVYSLEEIDKTAIKHHLNLTAEEFEKEYDWNGVFEVNKEERDYYREE